jgi:signal transduction histidine kinase
VIPRDRAGVAFRQQRGWSRRAGASICAEMSHTEPESSGNSEDGSRSDKRETVLRRTTVRPGGSTPDPVDSVFVANRLTTLTHELANLLDGSLRTLAIARRSVDDAAVQNADPAELSRRLSTVHIAMEQMAHLVRAGMKMMDGTLPSPSTADDAVEASALAECWRWASLAEAVTHAAEVMRPLCDEKRVALKVAIAREATTLAAGPMHAVAVNAIRNSLESIQRVPDHQEGKIDVYVHVEHDRHGRSTTVLTVTDNGEGLPDWLGPSASEVVFQPGVSMKPGSSGVGLALARSLVHSLGGTITLRRGSPECELDTPGAVLEARWPMRELQRDGRQDANAA